MMQFDTESNMQEFTFVLSTRGHKHLGQLFNVHEPVSSVNFNAANEIAFTVYKYSDYENGIQEPLWDEITDFKYVWVKELNEYYEITVELSDEEFIYKSVTGISACECELSQNYVYGLEVNTELDISRSDYKNPTIFYKPENPKESLFHRLLSYAPHYTIKHVDTSIAGIQRTFSIDDADIYSCLVDTIAPEIGCIFIFDTVDRTISAYDLKTVCNDCGERGEFSDVCPECGSTDLKYYGEDTTVLVDTENLANNITFTTDTESVKNCFKLEAGDDNMTAAVVNLNPSGTPYIYYFSEDMKHDMSDELVEKLDGYDKLHKSYDSEYSKLMSEQYECIDKIVYYTSEMMPTREDSPTDASKEAAKLTEENLSPVGLTSVTTSTSTTTVNSALKNYAKVYVKSGYFKIEINEGEFVYEGEDTEGNHYGYWYGSFKITNYSDEEDSAISPTIKVKVYDLYQTFIEQKIAKKIKDEDEEDGSVFDVLSIKDLDDFTEAIKLYCLNRLTSFYDAIQGVLDIMIEQDQANEFADLYETIYVPYRNKLDACQKEIDAREDTIKGYEDRLDVAEKRQSEIHLALDFEAYIGEELYKEFCAFKREQTYSNENYISDGLDNDEIFERAKEFIDVAKKELIKSGENQHSISGSLSNILAMEEFSPLKDKFKIGNFIRIRIDSHLYRLRLIGYQIQFDENGNSNIDVEFSDVTKIRDGVTDMQSILNQVTSMSSSYDSFKNQVIGSQESIDQVTSWIKDGLDLTNTKIVSTAKNQDIVYNKNGILVRSYDDITETYSPEQLKIVNSTIAITDDDWKTVKTAVGRFNYIDPISGEQKTGYGINSEVLVGNLMIGKGLIIKNSDNTFEIGDSGLIINTTSKTADRRLFRIQKDGSDKLFLDSNGNLIGNDITINNLIANSGSFNGKIVATSGNIGDWDINDGLLENNSVVGSSNKTTIIDPKNHIISFTSIENTSDTEINLSCVFSADGISYENQIFYKSTVTWDNSALYLSPDMISIIDPDHGNSSMLSISVLSFESGATKTILINGGKGSITAVGSITGNTYISSSDRRLKENIKYIDLSPLVDDIKVCAFDFINGKKNNVGIIANDYIDNKYSKYFLTNFERDGTEYYGVNYQTLFMAAIQKIHLLERNIKDIQQKLMI